MASKKPAKKAPKKPAKKAPKKTTASKKKGAARKTAKPRSGLRINVSASPLLVKFCESTGELFSIDHDLKGSWQGPLLEKVRAYVLCDGIIREVLPIVLKLEGNSDAARALSSYPQINDTNAGMATATLAEIYKSIEDRSGVRNKDSVNAVWMAIQALDYTSALEDLYGLADDYHRIGYTAGRCVVRVTEACLAADGGGVSGFGGGNVHTLEVAGALGTIFQSLIQADEQAAVVAQEIVEAAESASVAAEAAAEPEQLGLDFEAGYHAPTPAFDYSQDVQDDYAMRGDAESGLDEEELAQLAEARAARAARASNPRHARHAHHAHRPHASAHHSHHTSRHRNPGAPDSSLSAAVRRALRGRH
jgi:hypothetical protein